MASGLADFCRCALGRAGPGEVLDPLVLAALFRDYFGIRRTPSLGRAFDFTSALGVVVEEVDYLEAGGTNMHSGGQWHIHFSAHEPRATQKFTIFHEVFEILIKTLKAMAQLQLPRGMERSANRFAAAVLMPPEFFWNRMVATGCDPVLLAEELELSHQALLIGFAERLEDFPFAAALYEYAGPAFTEWLPVEAFVAGLVVRTARARGLRRVSPRQWLPARNGGATRGSLVCMAIRGNRPVLWSPDPFEGMNDAGWLTTLVRPISWRDEHPGRVFLLGLPDEHYHLIEPQVERLAPMTIPIDPEPCPAADSSRRCRKCPHFGHEFF